MDDPSLPPPRGQGPGSALDLSETTASVLVRRGYGDPAQARAFLAAGDPGHDPFLLGAMREACDAIRETIAAGRRICVHGDYDVDGICATALAVLRAARPRRRRRLAPPEPLRGGLRRRAARRSNGSPTRAAGFSSRWTAGSPPSPRSRPPRRAGSSVVVTDHHRPGRDAAGLPVVAPRPSDYPFPELCGTGVVWKLLQALGAPDLERRLDLVALATVADVVPLVDENRYLVSAGLRRLARTTKPGPARAHAAPRASIRRRSRRAQLGFRLAPRINAAGRLGHPRAALEMLLTDDAAEAERLAGELETLNRDRQAVEERILREAIAPGARVARAGAAPPRLRARGRGLASRRDRHRRLAARRAVRPARSCCSRPGRKAGSAPAARSRRSTCTARSAPAPST